MTGTEFLRTVKQDHPNTVRMILSGYSELSTITDAINQGSIFKFITKPWEDELILKAINEAFEYHELTAQNLKLTEELKETNEKLAALNKALENKVEEKTRKLQLNVASLKVYQEALEHFPYAVIGVDDRYQVVLENAAARQLLTCNNSSSLGLELEAALPASLKPTIQLLNEFVQSNAESRLREEVDHKILSFFNISQSTQAIGTLIIANQLTSNGSD